MDDKPIEQVKDQGFWERHKILKGVVFFVFLVLLIDLPIQISKIIKGQRQVSMRDAFESMIPTDSDVIDGETMSETDWRTMRTLDSGNAQMRAQFHQKLIKIPGYMVPLEDSVGETAEFLLVPSQQACIHVPPPPMNQTIYVKMHKNQPTPTIYGPIWVEGRFFFFDQSSAESLASFAMAGLKVYPYKDQE
jgi:hypothetical protein